MKRWWQSKTNWFNLSIFVAASADVLTYIADVGFDKETTAQISMGLTLLGTVGNGYLRSITSTAIGKPVDHGFNGGEI